MWPELWTNPNLTLNFFMNLVCHIQLFRNVVLLQKIAALTENELASRRSPLRVTAIKPDIAPEQGQSRESDTFHNYHWHGILPFVRQLDFEHVGTESCEGLVLIFTNMYQGQLVREGMGWNVKAKSVHDTSACNRLYFLQTSSIFKQKRSAIDSSFWTHHP